MPKRGQGDLAARLATFKAEAERAQASVAEVAEWADAPAEIARYLARRQFAGDLAHGRRSAPRRRCRGAKPRSRFSAAHPTDATSTPSRPLSRGVAETGTLALVSGADNPTTLNFLPDNHIVVLPRDEIDGDYESVFAKLRGVYGKGAAPRTVNFITGPSRSADIEQTLLLGAHGPRRLHIVVVG